MKFVCYKVYSSSGVCFESFKELPKAPCLLHSGVETFDFKEHVPIN